MHPEDAAARGLDDGDDVRVFNELGEVRCALQIGTWVRPGVVSLPKGLWRKSTANSNTATTLAPDTLTDIAGGACFNDARVRGGEGVVRPGLKCGPHIPNRPPPRLPPPPAYAAASPPAARRRCLPPAASQYE